MMQSQHSIGSATVWLTSVFVAIVLISASCQKKVSKTDNMVAVTITVTQTSSYCGGAAPPDYVLQELMTPRPLSGHAVFIREGDDNDISKPVIADGVSDAIGQIRLNLRPGNYCLVFGNKKDRGFADEMISKFSAPSASYSAVDRACLEAWLLTSELVFEVNQGGPQNFTVNYHSHCSWDQWPCVSYFGPLPP